MDFLDQFKGLFDKLHRKPNASIARLDGFEAEVLQQKRSEAAKRGAVTRKANAAKKARAEARKKAAKKKKTPKKKTTKK